MKLAFSCWWSVLMVLLLGAVCFAQVWVARYNGPGNNIDEATAIAVDGTGNVYVTGRSVGSGTSWDYATIKYNSAGDTLWVRRYNGPGIYNYDDWAYAIAVDGTGNVYVTGESYGSGTYWDYATIKYNSAGDTLWVRRYNGPGNYNDYAYAIAVDGAGNVYVTGYSYESGTDYDYATIKYNSAGDTVWVRRYNGPGNYDDGASAIAVDGTGNVYVTGWSIGSGTDYDYATIKYNSAGDTVWVRRYNGPGNYNYDDWAYAIAVDGTGNVYVTGTSWGSGTYRDYATIKYNSAGEPVWVRRYNGPGYQSDGASAIAVDGTGNVYVTGASIGSGTDYDYATIKYSAGVGVEEWENPKSELRVSPNPAIGSAVINYVLPWHAQVSLSVYDISGRLVRTIYFGLQEKGYHEVKLNSEQMGSPLPPGIYFIRFEAGAFKATHPLRILR